MHPNFDCVKSGYALNRSEALIVDAGAIRKYFQAKLPTECAEDLTQETLLRVYKSRKSTRILSPHTYARGIARHVYLDFLRRKYRVCRVTLTEQLPEVKSEVGDPYSALEDSESWHRCMALIATLSASDRALLQLYCLDGLKSAEVAERMKEAGHSISPVTVRTRLLVLLEKICQVREQAGGAKGGAGRGGIERMCASLRALELELPPGPASG